MWDRYQGDRENLDEWLAFLYKRRGGIKLGIERIEKVAKEFGLTSFDFPVITVAGTNGKGSTVKALSSIFSAKYKVVSITSPHLIKFNERICINNEPCSSSMLCKVFDFIDQSESAANLSFFELATIAGLIITKEVKPDILILEVGLGGRLDATNVVKNDISIVTSISFDHVAFLGDTLEKIATEKAGIFKQDTVAFLGENVVQKSIFDIAKTRNVKLKQSVKDFGFIGNDNKHWKMGDYSISLSKYSIFPQSVSLCLAAIRELKDRLPIDNSSIASSLSKAEIAGRLQKINYNGVNVLLDLAHNEAGAKYLTKYIKNNPVRGKNIALWHSFADKSLDKIVLACRETFTNWHIYSDASKHERGSAAEELITALGSEPHNLSSDLATALDCAIAECSIDDRLVVFGGFAIVGEVLAILSTTNNNLPKEKLKESDEK